MVAEEGDLDGEEVDDGAGEVAEDGGDAEEHPKGRAVFAVIEQNELRGSFGSDGFADLEEGGAGSVGALEKGGGAAEDLAARVAGELEEGGAGEDDGVAGEGGVGDGEAVREEVEGVARLAGVARLEGSFRCSDAMLLHLRCLRW